MCSTPAFWELTEQTYISICSLSNDASEDVWCDVLFAEAFISL